jgi:signal transduction histidine kinase
MSRENSTIMSAHESSVPLNPAQGVTLALAGNGVETIDARMLVLLRCVLAFSALAVLAIDPPGIGRLVELAYFGAGLYCAYTVLLAAISYRLQWPAPPRALHWADVAFYSFLIALTGGTGSIFFLFFFYPVMVASFCWGSREGIVVTAASSALFVVVGLSSPEAHGQSTTLVPAAYLLIFGYLISYFGGYERLLRRRLALLREINNLWNPRFGVDHTHGINLDRLLEFYGGSSCVLVLRRPTPALHYVMYSASRDRPGYSSTPSYVAEGAADALLRLPDSLAAFYHGPASSWWGRLRGYSGYDFELGARTSSFLADCAAWANLLDAKAFVTVPYVQRDGTSGRIFLTADHGGFGHADIDFLAQVSDAMSTVVENMSLVEQLITKAAEHERNTISRDLHDTTIQPYIGIKLALDALYREAGPDGPLSNRIFELTTMAELTIRDLRQYASTLKDKTAMPGEFLVAAVKNQSERLGRFYGINVEVKSDISPRLQGRLAAESYQIIAEGLSNVLRHSSAKRAFVEILCENSTLLLKIGNEANGESSAKSFMPRSISERAQMLGGKAFVEQRAGAQTVVHVTIPM